MTKKQYSLDDSPQTSDPLSTILQKLEGITRLDKKLDVVTHQFHGELDFPKNELGSRFLASGPRH